MLEAISSKRRKPPIVSLPSKQRHAPLEDFTGVTFSKTGPDVFPPGQKSKFAFNQPAGPPIVRKRRTLFSPVALLDFPTSL